MLNTNNIDENSKEKTEVCAVEEEKGTDEAVVFNKINIGQILMFCAVAFFVVSAALLVISEVTDTGSYGKGITMFSLSFMIMLPASVISMIVTSIITIVMSKHCVKLRGSLSGKICLYFSSIVALCLLLLYTVIILIVTI